MRALALVALLSTLAVTSIALAQDTGGRFGRGDCGGGGSDYSQSSSSDYSSSSSSSYDYGSSGGYSGGGGGTGGCKGVGLVFVSLVAMVVFVVALQDLFKKNRPQGRSKSWADMDVSV